MAISGVLLIPDGMWRSALCLLAHVTASGAWLWSAPGGMDTLEFRVAAPPGSGSPPIGEVGVSRHGF
jgi:hypothetical protein